jgi:putative endonuclease
MHFVYILYSSVHDRYYIGQTGDVQERLVRHNHGTEKATAPYLPWDLIWFAEKPTRGEAMILERKLKNLSRLRLKAFMEKYPVVAGADDSSAGGMSAC